MGRRKSSKGNRKNPVFFLRTLPETTKEGGQIFKKRSWNSWGTPALEGLTGKKNIKTNGGNPRKESRSRGKILLGQKKKWVFR